MKSILHACLLTAFATLSSLTNATPTSYLEDRSCSGVTCTPYGAAHIIVTRASTEAPGPGILGVVANAVAAQCPGSDVVATPYPATLTDYLTSEAEGVGNLTALVTSYVACCPSSKIVLMGYSQGAQVTADFLCGTSELGFTPTVPYDLIPTINLAVAAVILMGDPSFVKGLPWDVGTANNVSYFPRLNEAPCYTLTNRMQSYCDANDFFCDNGTSIAVHEGYVQEYGAAATKYSVSKIPGCPSS